MKMKMSYICFVRFTNEILTSKEKFNALQEKTMKLSEKNKLKLVYAGTPWGVDDHGVYVFESEGGLDAWGNFAMEWIGSLKPGAFSEIANTRTIAVNIM